VSVWVRECVSENPHTHTLTHPHTVLQPLTPVGSGLSPAWSSRSQRARSGLAAAGSRTVHPVSAPAVAGPGRAPAGRFASHTLARAVTLSIACCPPHAVDKPYFSLSRRYACHSDTLRVSPPASAPFAGVKRDCMSSIVSARYACARRASGVLTSPYVLSSATAIVRYSTGPASAHYPPSTSHFFLPSLPIPTTHSY